jgi:7,8-dihydropterin-6-yl-methyl-4-(beta-D-ribofuranosyl)aminobenzene 5'-phosphate synthase
MTFRITVLCENTVGPISGTLGEHGFSALIEHSNGEPFLFDTGQGATLLHNARHMNKGLANIRKVVISHGHYDHSGGLLPLLQECGSSRIYGHPDIFSPRFRVKDNGECISIGIPWSRSVLEEAGATFDLSADFRKIAPKMFLTGEVPRSISFEIGDRGLFCDCAGQQPDSTPDDQSLILETGKGLVIVLGCCHAGLANTLKQVTQTIGRDDVYAMIGGTHLGFCSKEQIDNTISVLKKSGIRKLAASHCTGFAASARLSHELPKVFQPAHVGYTLEV